MKDISEWWAQLIYVGVWIGVALVYFRQMRKDLTGVAGKTREQESKRLKKLAVDIELAAEDPTAVRRLAHHLHDTV